MLANLYHDPLRREEFLSDFSHVKDSLFDTNDVKTNTAFFDLTLRSSLQVLASPTTTPEKLMANALLLPIKLQLFYDSSTAAIYEFAIGKLKVFELTGLPNTKQSYIYYYDEQDQGHLLTTSAEQDEIDFILNSLRLNS